MSKSRSWNCNFKRHFLKLTTNEPFCLGRAAHLQKACCTPSVSLQPRNSLHLALTSDPQSLSVGSHLGLQERAVKWRGKQNTAIHNLHPHVMICWIWLCALASEQYPGSWGSNLTNLALDQAMKVEVVFTKSLKWCYDQDMMKLVMG